MWRLLPGLVFLGLGSTACSVELGQPPNGTSVFATDVLHQVDITVDPSYMEALANDREHRVPCTITFDGELLDNVGIRQKGGYGSLSSLDEKPGFSIRFNELVPGQKLDGLKKVILNNAKQDQTFLSEHLGYELYRRAGLPAPRTAYALVTLNQRSYGLFVVKEAIDGKFLDYWFGDSFADGNLYEGGFTQELGSPPDFVTRPQDIELKDEADEQRTRDDLMLLSSLIENASDGDFLQVVAPYLDIDAFLTGYAVDSLVNHWDGYSFNTNNYYMYNNPKDGRFVFLPHGMDQILQEPIFEPTKAPKGELSQRIRDTPELDERFRAELGRVMREAWNVEELQARVDQAADVIHTAATIEDPRVRGDLDRFDGNVERVRALLGAHPYVDMQSGELLP